MSKNNLLPTEKTKISLFMGLSLILVATTGFVFAMMYINNIRNQIQEKKVELQSEQLFSINVQDMKGVLSSNSAELNSFESYFVMSDGIISYLDYLERTAMNLGVELELTLSSDRKSVGQKAANLSALQLNLNGRGSLQNLLNFMERIALDRHLSLWEDTALVRNSPTVSRTLVDGVEVVSSEQSDVWSVSITQIIYEAN